MARREKEQCCQLGTASKLPTVQTPAHCAAQHSPSTHLPAGVGREHGVHEMGHRQQLRAAPSQGLLLHHVCNLAAGGCQLDLPILAVHLQGWGNGGRCVCGWLLGWLAEVAVALALAVLTWWRLFSAAASPSACQHPAAAIPGPAPTSSGCLFMSVGRRSR